MNVPVLLLWFLVFSQLHAVTQLVRRVGNTQLITRNVAATAVSIAFVHICILLYMMTRVS